jgi:stage IV sporulation protein FB
MSTEKFKIEIGGGFFIMLSLIYYIYGFSLLAALLLAAIIHELGHIAALELMGVSLSKISLTAFGASIDCERKSLSYIQAALCALSGPLAGLLLYFLLLPLNEAYAQVSLMLSILNLLPVRSLDGGQALYNLSARFLGESLAGRLLCITGCFCMVLMFAAGIITANIMLAAAAVWLLIDFIASPV